MSSPARRVRALVHPRPELCSALSPDAQPRLAALNERLSAFYNGPARAHYFATSEVVNEEWPAAFKPHHDLSAAIPPGSHLLDLGCGAALACEHLADRFGTYTGVDWSTAQIEKNQQRWPQHRFVSSSIYNVPLDAGAADVVISMYVIEHCVWPHRLLDEMYRLARPGGLLAVLTPPFRYGSYLKSFDYGLTPKPFEAKLRSGALLDALLHLYHHRLYYPWYLRRHYPRTDRNRFLIHLDPVVLRSAEWFPDADAVYLTDTGEIAAYVEGIGAQTVTHWPRWGYVLLKKNDGV